MNDADLHALSLNWDIFSSDVLALCGIYDLYRIMSVYTFSYLYIVNTFLNQVKNIDGVSNKKGKLGHNKFRHSCIKRRHINGSTVGLAFGPHSVHSVRNGFRNVYLLLSHETTAYNQNQARLLMTKSQKLILEIMFFCKKCNVCK